MPFKTWQPFPENAPNQPLNYIQPSWLLATSITKSPLTTVIYAARRINIPNCTKRKQRQDDNGDDEDTDGDVAPTVRATVGCSHHNIHAGDIDAHPENGQGMKPNNRRPGMRTKNLRQLNTPPHQLSQCDIYICDIYFDGDIPLKITA